MSYLMDILFNFTFFYPFLMAYTWIFGSIIFRMHRGAETGEPPDIPGNPSVSILIPCHNEEDCIRETVRRIVEYQNYPNYEIIAIDDASTDKTPEILRDLSEEHECLRVVTLTSNQGKGMGMSMAAMVSRSEYLVGIDADAILDPNALRWLLWHLVNFPRVGAVTGNPKVRNRTTMLAKIQVGEYSSIIGMIKRTQRILGKIYTVSGVIVALRKRALLDIGFWSNDMVTEDIDISWKIQLNFWDIRYEPRALCWILVPETLAGIFKQRLRWAQGGNEVLLKYYHCLTDWRQRRIWPLYIEYAVSVFWCYCFVLTVLLYLVNLVVPLPRDYVVRSLIPGWTGVIMAITCVIQFSIGLLFDARYDKSLRKLIVWLIWYPAVYWIVNMIVTVIAFPKALLKRKGTLAVWESPDRGV